MTPKQKATRSKLPKFKIRSTGSKRELAKTVLNNQSKLKRTKQKRHIPKFTGN